MNPFNILYSSLLKCPEWPESRASLVSHMTANVRKYWPSGGVESSVFKARFPDRKKLLRMANLACRKYIQYWHPWHMEKTHFPYRLEDEIDWFVPPNGDHEWIESLVRFNHMIDLAAAYQLTGKRKFLLSFKEYIVSFNRSRDQPGRHWGYPLNPAIRIMNLVRAYGLLCRDENVDDETHLAVHQCLLLDVDFLLPVLEKAVGNGAFFITTALLVAAEFLEDLYSVEKWREPAAKRLYEVMNSEIHADGVEVEQAPMYHGQVFLTLLDYCVARLANGEDVDQSLKQTLERLLEVLVEIADPEGLIPPIGDSDRFSVAYLAGFYQAVMGKELGFNEKCVIRKMSGPFRVKVFPDAGWVVVRWWFGDKQQGYLFFDCSRKPPSGRAGHSHADELQMLLHDSKGPIVTDPGRFTYCPDFKAYFPFTRRRIFLQGKFRLLYRIVFPRFFDLATRDWKSHFRKTLCHNTISPDGRDQPGYESRDQAGPNIELSNVVQKGPMVLLEGMLDALEGQECGLVKYTQHRTIVGCYPGIWIVFDRLNSDQAHDWIGSWHCYRSNRVALGQRGAKTGRDEGKYKIWFIAPDANMDIQVDDDWVSPVYNKKYPAKVLRSILRKRCEAVLITVFLPEVGRVTSDGIEALKLPDREGGEHTVYFLRLDHDGNSLHVRINPDQAWVEYDGVVTDALVLVEERHSKGLAAVSMVKGGGFEKNGSKFSGQGLITHHQLENGEELKE